MMFCVVIASVEFSAPPVKMVFVGVIDLEANKNAFPLLAFCAV